VHVDIIVMLQYNIKKKNFAFRQLKFRITSLNGQDGKQKVDVEP